MTDPHPHWLERAAVAHDRLTREDTVTICWTGEDAVRRRIRFEPRSTGGCDRIEQRWSGDEWVTVGQEIVARLGLDAPAKVIIDGEPAPADD
jgi:hypothetical protein